MGVSRYVEDAWANTLRGGGKGNPFLAPDAVFAQLHTGEPGPQGTRNAALETSRREVQFGPAQSGVLALTNDAHWPSVRAAETFTHISLWDAREGGNCLGFGALNRNVRVEEGDGFELRDLTIGVD